MKRLAGGGGSHFYFSFGSLAMNLNKVIFLSSRKTRVLPMMNVEEFGTDSDDPGAPSHRSGK